MDRTHKQESTVCRVVMRTVEKNVSHPRGLGDDGALHGVLREGLMGS